MHCIVFYCKELFDQVFKWYHPGLSWKISYNVFWFRTLEFNNELNKCWKTIILNPFGSYLYKDIVSDVFHTKTLFHNSGRRFVLWEAINLSLIVPFAWDNLILNFRYKKLMSLEYSFKRHGIGKYTCCINNVNTFYEFISKYLFH